MDHILCCARKVFNAEHKFLMKGVTQKIMTTLSLQGVTQKFSDVDN